MKVKIAILAAVLSGLSTITLATELAPEAIAGETCHMGVMVQKLQVAIKSPENPESLQTIYLYGTDSRYYPMVRGWLSQELLGVESQLNASHSVLDNVKFTHLSDFLKKAINSIDLK